MSRPFTMIAALVFLIVAAAHVARLALNLDVVVGEFHVPTSASIAGAIISGLLAVLVWREASR